MYPQYNNKKCRKKEIIFFGISEEYLFSQNRDFKLDKSQS
jgi:hypothetical protein